MGFLSKFKRGGKGGGQVDIDKLAARAAQAGADPQVVKEVLEESRGADGKIDWNAAATKAQARGLDVSKLRNLMK
jgi:hypothetical protein